MKRFMMASPSQGPWPSIFAAAAEHVRKEKGNYKGKYLSSAMKVEQPSSQARDIRLAEDLWRVSEQAVEEMLWEELVSDGRWLVKELWDICETSLC